MEGETMKEYEAPVLEYVATDADVISTSDTTPPVDIGNGDTPAIPAV
ncbi:MAG: hypothetical protein IJD51_05270 [Clostridia bacterium]|nr:hypothetical protein [Clostridia bacterium]